jgi:hypothetical protein
MTWRRTWIVALLAVSLAGGSLGLPACGAGGAEAVAKTFDGMHSTLDTVNQDPNRSAVAQMLDECARDARDGKISMMESVMFRNELNTAAKDGMIADVEITHLRAQYDTMIKE